MKPPYRTTSDRAAFFILCCVHFFFGRGHNVDTPSKKDVSASLQKRPFSLCQMRKTPIFLRTCQPLLLLLRIQQLLRLHQPSGCCPLQHCNSMYFPVILKAYENQRISAVFPVFLLYYIFFRFFLCLIETWTQCGHSIHLIQNLLCVLFHLFCYMLINIQSRTNIFVSKPHLYNFWWNTGF